MKIKFLGAGSAFTMKGFQTNILVEENGKKLLLDAGSDIRWALKEQKLTYKDIDDVYISHGHGDHMGGLEYLGFCSYFDPNKEKIKIHGHKMVLAKMWDGGLRAGMESLEGLTANLYTYFAVDSMDDNASFLWQGIRFDICQSVHVMTDHTIVPSFGLIIHSPTTTKTIYWTSDSQYAPSQLIKFYNDADLIIQDCETSPFKSRVHAHYDDLKLLPDSVRSKMILTHYNDNILNDDGSFCGPVDLKATNEDGFFGFAMKGQIIEW